ncbi:DUF3311 domain-containing protein [Acidianus sp. RZ1]|uniref:DUF3311 domain-containing protein n=1 Tax=Acidianus sp. RZ1 TaxID=1540082 RepID=UPI00149207FE|nr:DUF3311 domain-containing protein [Acidianus sp. RZ1]
MANGFNLAALIVLLVLVIGYSIFPFFDKVNPSLGGLPFFYWYQIVMLVVASVLYALVSIIFKG